MKIDPADYDISEIATFIAEPHAMTLDQVLALDFPPPDYVDGEEPIWRYETVVAWLGTFHKALLTTEIAADPGQLDRLTGLMLQLANRREA